MDHPVDEPGMTIAVTKVDTYTQNVTVKQNGEVIDSGQMLISKDGKTMTLSQDDDPNTVEVFEKR
jgi:lipopolysaccharide export system protein LptA